MVLHTALHNVVSDSFMYWEEVVNEALGENKRLACARRCFVSLKLSVYFICWPITLSFLYTRSYLVVKHTSRSVCCSETTLFVLTYLSPKARLQNSAASALVMRKLSPWNRPLGKMAFNSASMWLKINDSLVRFRLWTGNGLQGGGGEWESYVDTVLLNTTTRYEHILSTHVKLWPLFTVSL